MLPENKKAKPLAGFAIGSPRPSPREEKRPHSGPGSLPPFVPGGLFNCQARWMMEGPYDGEAIPIERLLAYWPKLTVTGNKNPRPLDRGVEALRRIKPARDAGRSCLDASTNCAACHLIFFLIPEVLPRRWSSSFLRPVAGSDNSPGPNHDKSRSNGDGKQWPSPGVVLYCLNQVESSLFAHVSFNRVAG